MVKLFSDIYGQKKAINLLTSQIKNNRVSHSYLFLGAPGIGKKFLAMEFSKYLLCGCQNENNCQNCTLFNKGNHPDFLLIDGSQGIKIAEIREMIEKTNLSPNISKRKIVLLTNAENLGIEAANAMLKTLEEPPLDAVIVMTAVSTKSLPETIVSRSQIIKLIPLAPKEIKAIVKKNHPGKNVDEITFYSEGNIGEANKLFNDPDYFIYKKLLYSDVSTIFGDNSVINRFNVLDKYEKNKDLNSLFNTAFYLITKSLESETEPTTPSIQEIKKSIPSSERARLSRKMLKIYDDLQYNVNLRLLLEELILELKTDG